MGTRRQRRLARAAAGIGRDDTAGEIVGNVRAMELAVRRAAEPRPFTRDDLLAIHRTLFEATRDRAHDLADRIAALREAWLERLGHPRQDASSRALVGHLAGEPILGVARAAELAGVSETAAAKAVAALERAGILVAPHQRWGRRWEAPEVFVLLDDFEHDLATPGAARRPVRPAPRPHLV